VSTEALPVSTAADLTATAAPEFSNVPPGASGDEVGGGVPASGANPVEDLNTGTSYAFISTGLAGRYEAVGPIVDATALGPQMPVHLPGVSMDLPPPG